MKGLITRGLLAVCGLTSLALSSGCYTYDDFVDPCWPERYNHMAREEVRSGAGAQVQNGHVLDQTVWNFQFEPGTDKLTPGGMDHLAYLMRRRPAPDPQLYLQTAYDVIYEPAAPEKFTEARCDLDTKRIQAIQKFLVAITAGRHLEFQVAVHDPSDPGISAVPAYGAVRGMYSSVTGSLGGGGGGGGSSGGGGAR